MRAHSVLVLALCGAWFVACSGSGLSDDPTGDGIGGGDPQDVSGADAEPDSAASNDAATAADAAASVDATHGKDTASPADTATSPSDTATSPDGDTPPDTGQPPIGPGQFGSPCTEAEDCNSGYCVQSADGTVCSKTCEDNCPDGWSCKQLLSGGDAVFICLPNFPTLCMPCLENADCQLPGSESFSRCLPMGEEGAFCGGDCANVPCPEGYTCQDATDVSGQSTSQCVKDDGLCECSNLAIAKTAKTNCAVVNEFGTCQAERQCLADGLTPCEALIPAEEVCDGVDNNCDEAIDEGVSCDDDNPCTDDACDGQAG